MAFLTLTSNDNGRGLLNSRIEVGIDIDRTPQEVWAYVQDISSHVEWMADAEAIRFLGTQTHGAGTSFECDTKVGPLRMTDIMTVTSWDDASRMGVRHEGVVTGEGEFTLTPIDDAASRTSTRFTWTEELVFPIWMAGPVGAAVARPILAAIWRRNLARLKTRVESL